MLNGRLKQLLTFVAIAVVMAAMALLPPYARAEVVVDVYENGYEAKNPVAGNITRVKINKLDKSDREPIKGALLCIVKEETGEIVDKWETDGTTHEIARNLDIDTWYILKELSVPDGYSDNFKKLQDDPDTPHLIHFMITSDDFNTTGETDIDEEIAEFVDSEDIRGSGSEQAFVLNLYNESVRYVEEVKRRVRKRDNTQNEADGTQSQSQQNKDDKDKDDTADGDKDDKGANASTSPNSGSASAKGTNDKGPSGTNEASQGGASQSGAASQVNATSQGAGTSQGTGTSERQTSGSSQRSVKNDSQTQRQVGAKSSKGDASADGTPQTGDLTNATAAKLLVGAGAAMLLVAKVLAARDQ